MQSNLKIISSLILWSILVTGVRAQIIDDTTRLVYGPHTTFHFTEQEVIDNIDTLFVTDTLLTSRQRFDYIQSSGYRYQDLGVIGTSMHPVYPAPPSIIGVTPGFYSYDHYFKGPERIKYYDTKSPFIKMGIILGGIGRSVTDVSFSRNVNPRWNFGFDFRTLLIDKQVARTRRGDRRVESTSYDAYTSFRSKNERYRLLFSASRSNHVVQESGGIDTTGLASFFDDNVVSYLSNTDTKDVRINYRLYQQFRIGKILQIYHAVDKYRQANRFKSGLGSDTLIIGAGLFNMDDSDEQSIFRYWQNEAGIKGNIGDLFYRGYLKTRSVEMNYPYPDSMMVRPGHRVEKYLGFGLRYRFKSFELRGLGEIMETGNFQIKGSLTNPFFDADLHLVQYEPSFLQQAYFGNHDQWGNNFNSPVHLKLGGRVKIPLRKLQLYPTLQLHQVSDYIYFSQDSVPAQAGGSFQLLQPGLDLNLNIWKNIHLEFSGQYSLLTGDSEDVIRIPDLSFSSQVYVESRAFGVLDFQFGVDAHWNSSFLAPSYRVSVQQFYNQDLFEVPSFVIVDVFGNFKINRATLFLKLINLNQMISGEGYFVRRDYIGQANTIDFGLSWLFFD